MKVPTKQFENYLRNKRLKEKTIEHYIYYLMKFARFPGFNQETVNRFLAMKSNRNVVARAFLKNFKAFLKLNYREFGFSKFERLQISEVEFPDFTGRAEQRVIKPLTEKQILYLEKYLKGEKDKIQLLLTFYCGLRRAELFRIQIISFNWDVWKTDMSQYGECVVYGKGAKEGVCLVPPWLMRRVARYIKSNKFRSLRSCIFMRGVEDWTKVNLDNRIRVWNQHLQKAAIQAGITKLDERNRIIKDTAVFPHRIRHSYGYHLKVVEGMDAMEIQKMLRHGSIQSSQRYVQIDMEYLKKKLAKRAAATS